MTKKARTEPTWVTIAGLWPRERKDGSKYLGGSLGNGARLVLVKNEHRQDGRSPHYLLKVGPPSPKGHATREHDDFTTPEEEHPL